jgi:predicted nucleic acid-binding protein
MAKVVVADSGPLHYLVLIDCVDVLESLFDGVLIPEAVQSELSHPDTPAEVKAWLHATKPWLSVRQVSKLRPVAGLHRGETEALQLALELGVKVVLMDDMDGRNAAKQLGLVAVGTIGILELASERGLIQLPKAVAELRQTNFFISPRILDEALERNRGREKEK